MSDQKIESSPLSDAPPIKARDRGQQELLSRREFLRLVYCFIALMLLAYLGPESTAQANDENNGTIPPAEFNRRTSGNYTFYGNTHQPISAETLSALEDRFLREASELDISWPAIEVVLPLQAYLPLAASGPNEDATLADPLRDEALKGIVHDHISAAAQELIGHASLEGAAQTQLQAILTELAPVRIIITDNRVTADRVFDRYSGGGAEKRIHFFKPLSGRTGEQPVKPYYFSQDQPPISPLIFDACLRWSVDYLTDQQAADILQNFITQRGRYDASGRLILGSQTAPLSEHELSLYWQLNSKVARETVLSNTDIRMELLVLDSMADQEHLDLVLSHEAVCNAVLAHQQLPQSLHIHRVLIVSSTSQIVQQTTESATTKDSNGHTIATQQVPALQQEEENIDSLQAAETANVVASLGPALSQYPVFPWAALNDAFGSKELKADHRIYEPDVHARWLIRTRLTEAAYYSPFLRIDEGFLHEVLIHFATGHFPDTSFTTAQPQVMIDGFLLPQEFAFARLYCCTQGDPAKNPDQFRLFPNDAAVMRRFPHLISRWPTLYSTHAEKLSTLVGREINLQVTDANGGVSPDRINLWYTTRDLGMNGGIGEQIDFSAEGNSLKIAGQPFDVPGSLPEIEPPPPLTPAQFFPFVQKDGSTPSAGMDFSLATDSDESLASNLQNWGIFVRVMEPETGRELPLYISRELLAAANLGFGTGIEIALEQISLAVNQQITELITDYDHSVERYPTDKTADLMRYARISFINDLGQMESVPVYARIG